MDDDLIRLLDRQHDHLQGIGDDRGLLLAVPRHVRLLHENPLLTPILDEIRQEASAALEAYRTAEAGVVERLKSCRARFTELAPDLDDSEDATDSDDPSSHYSFATFDGIAASAPDVFMSTDPTEMRRAQRPQSLFQILDARLLEAQFPAERNDGIVRRADTNQRPELDEIRGCVAVARELDESAWRKFNTEVRSSPGVALERLRWIVQQIAPDPRVPVADDEEGFHRAMEEAFGERGILAAALHGASYGGMSKQFFEGKVEALAANVRDWVTSLHSELCRRIGLSRTIRVTVHRFKVRCEAYPDPELTDLAEKGDENDLTGYMARYLFDNGLAPVTRPLVARLEPDLIGAGPASFYLEAKQSKSRAASRKSLVDGARQVWDLAGHFAAWHPPITDVYLVLFLRGGPMVLTPDLVQHNGITVHPVVVDLRPTQTRGSRSREKPLVITEQDLLPDADVAS